MSFKIVWDKTVLNIWKFHFLQALVSQKLLSLLQVIFRATELWQITKLEIFWKELFFTSVSSTNLILKDAPITVQKCFLTVFTSIYQKVIKFEVPMHFERHNGKKKFRKSEKDIFISNSAWLFGNSFFRFQYLDLDI